MPHWLRTLFMFHWLLRRKQEIEITEDEVRDILRPPGKGHPTRKRKLCETPISPIFGRNQTGHSVSSGHSKRKKMSTNKKRRQRRLRAQRMSVRQRSAYSEVMRVRREAAKKVAFLR